jgi:molybdate transport system substrate-binding protein
MKRCIVFFFVLFSFFAFAQDKSVKIAAAANLTYVLEELKTDFMKSNPDIKVETTYGSSGNFATQIQQGAPFDIFMSADMAFPEKLSKAGFAATEPKSYAKGKLIIFTTKKLDLKKGIKVFKDKSITTVSICNPDTAPYGAASVEALTSAGLIKDIEGKFVKTESVSQVIQQVITAADIGFTAKSLVFSKDMVPYKEGVNWVEVDPKLYKKIDQGLIILKAAKDKPEAKAFYDYIFSDKAKPIFIKFGYEF